MKLMRNQQDTSILPFEINETAIIITIEAHMSLEEWDKVFGEFIAEQNNVIKLSEYDVGKNLRIAAIRRSYETSKGVKDMIIYADIENVGKPNGEEYNQLEGELLLIEFVEVGEITDNYLDFMTMIQNLNKKQKSEI